MLVSVDQLVGTTFGNYFVEQQLGQGNLSSVYAAQQYEQGRAVMLTVFVIPQACVGSARERFMERFMHEASTLVRLQHPHILPVYDFGEQYGYPYLVTPLHEGNSVASLLKMQTRCTPQQTLKILKQAADGLDYVHSQGVYHGSLKPANILLDDSGVQISGFGLGRMLEMRGIGQVVHSHPHLFSIAGTFLTNPEYIAPEVVQGAPVDARSDVYALGIILFELLTGASPFRSQDARQDPFKVAMQHVEQRMPSLQTKNPDLPLALDLVIQRALERDPAQRLASAGKLAVAFERAMRVLREAARQPESAQRIAVPAPKDATLPPTVNWFEEEVASSMAQQGKQSLPTPSGKVAALGSASKPLPALNIMPAPALREDDGNWQLKPPVVTNPMAAVRADGSLKVPQRSSQQLPVPEPLPGIDADELEIDPLTWWSSESSPSGMVEPGAFAQERPTNVQAPVEPEKAAKAAKKSSRKVKSSPKNEMPKAKAPSKMKAPKNRAPDKGRRRIVLFATGGVIAASAIGVGGFELMHFLQNGRHPASSTMSMTQTGAAQTMPTQAAQMQNGMAKATPTQANQMQNGAAKTAPTKAAQSAAPTAKAQPGHQGMVIGSTTLATNSAQTFTNPADKQDALLIRLPNGNFVAYERACTHVGVPVNYDPQTHEIKCPAHGSIFDPANKAMVLQGPAQAPLTMVAIHVNQDGTITV